MNKYEQIDATTFRTPGEPFTALFGPITITGVNGTIEIPDGFVLTYHTYTWGENNVNYSIDVLTTEEFLGGTDDRF